MIQKLSYPISCLLLLASCTKGRISPTDVAKVITSPTHLAYDFSGYAFFLPPENWILSDPEILSPTVQIGFLKKQEGFCPSINLAIEPTEVSQEEYLQAIQIIHENHHADRWRRLGKIPTQAGIADLTELDMTTEWGPARLLQMVLVKGGSAYIMTAAAMKKEIATYYSAFQNSFRSLQITPSLIEVVPEIHRKEKLRQFQDQCHHTPQIAQDPTWHETIWLPIQEEILNHYTDMGAHWQILFLKTLHAATPVEPTTR